MPIDFVAVLEEEAERAVAALTAAPEAIIPWSDDWTVAACGQHLFSAVKWAGLVVAGRPDTDWAARNQLDAPAPDDPMLPAWCRESAAGTAQVLRTVPPTEACWTWWPERQDVGFWSRRMAHEATVHRWDLELGAGITGAPIDPVVASDGIDEYLEAFLGIARFLHEAPGAGETFHVHCTDTDGEWLVAFPGRAERELRREHAKGDVAYRGPAAGLLLFLWGRLDADAAGVEVLGDPDVAARWSQLAPSM